MNFINRLLTNKAEDCIVVTSQLLNALNINSFYSSVSDEIQSHPGYPSILSISELLNKWKVENITMKIDRAYIDELPQAFIAHVRYPVRGFRVVVNHNAEYITCLDLHSKKYKVSRKDFFDSWDGVVLVAEKNDASGEIGYHKKRNKRLLSSACLLLLTCLLGYSILNYFSTLDAVILSFLAPAFIIKTLGVIVGILLILLEIDQGNQIGKAMCGDNGNKSKCSTVLDSKYGKIAGIISLSSITYLYMSATMLLVVFYPAAPQAWSIISLLSVISLPFVIYSIVAQWVIIKHWCILCVITDILLLLECVNVFLYRERLAVVNVKSLIDFSPAFIFSILSLMGLRWIFSLTVSRKDYSLSLRRLYTNSKVMNTILSSQLPVTTDPTAIGIILGNPTAENEIIKVCNPYCKPCSKAHKSIHELLDADKDLRVRIIFAVNDNPEDKKYKPVEMFLAAYNAGDHKLLLTMLDDWYLAEKKDFTAFKQKFDVNIEAATILQQVSAMSHWCKKEGIFGTPSFYVNGHKMPAEYSYNKIKYFLK
ncbi:MAG: thioredoxin domain-containing protein [Chitinophaga sp.]|uniref:vitamin K epoxide reductase family protein n=1 Tax=Chitinophaga sp. TaxID=1869181 RepID=UPI001B265561|nr:vitamin K epoxide reductase family protein [Chitinophaga sp.]MBO9728598.1 thioredoxin domain-containing protein [Chitinophaga sp.]